jgi:5'-nucleotidase
VFGLLHNLQISVTPVNVHGHVDPEISATATDWLSAVDSPDKEKESPASPAVGEQEDAAAQENEASSAT